MSACSLTDRVLASEAGDASSILAKRTFIMKKIANFLFEASTLKRLPRLGYNILGVKNESIAEHVYGSCVIGFVLARLAQANIEKVILMCLFHDFEETRTGDITKINLFYIKRDSQKAKSDIFGKLPFAKDVQSLLDEYEEKKSLEAKIARDANILDLLVELKVLIDQGNKHAVEWFEGNKERLKTPNAKKLFEQLQKTDSHDWWEDIREKVHRMYKTE